MLNIPKIIPHLRFLVQATVEKPTKSMHGCQPKDKTPGNIMLNIPKIIPHLHFLVQATVEKPTKSMHFFIHQTAHKVTADGGLHGRKGIMSHYLLLQAILQELILHPYS